MPSLTLSPDFTVDVTEQYAVAQSPAGPGPIHRRAVHDRRRQRLRLTYPLLSSDGLATLLALFDAVRGTAGRFDFTPPDEGSPKKFRFADDKLPWRHDSPSYASATFDIVEAF